MDRIKSGYPAGSESSSFGPADYIKITVLGFAISALWSSLHSIILPLRLLDFVAESEKNTYLGLLSGAGLILAIIVQPVAGAISDRSGYRWGRRRPYILLGTIATLLLLPGIGLAGSYVAIVVVYCLLQIGSNTVQGPHQGFIPDLVPEGRRGLASGVKNLFEVVGGVALLRLIGLFMDHYLAGEGASWLWLSLGIVAVVLLGAMVATVLTVRERPAGDSALPSLVAPFRSFGIFVQTWSPSVWPVISRLRLFILEHPDFTWFLLSRLLILMAFAIMQRFTIYYMRDVVGIASPAALTADLLMVVGIGMLAAVYPAGRLSDRLGRRPIGVFSGLLGALGIALLFFADSYSLILVSGGLLGVASGAFLSSNWALATDLVARGEEARYLGLTNLATAGAAALVLFIIGPAIDLLNTCYTNLGYSIMLLVCFIFLIVGSLLLMRISFRGQPR